MIDKTMGGVKEERGLVADAGGDSDVVRNVSVQNVPKKCGGEAAPEVRWKDREGAEVNMSWLGALDFRDRCKSARQEDAEEQGVAGGDLCGGPVKRREVLNAEE